MNEKMKIVHITKGSGGGMGVICKKIINFMSKKSEQDLLYFKEWDESKKYKKLNGLFLWGEPVFLNFSSFLRELYSADVIHIHSTRPWLLFSPLFLFKNKTIYTFHIAFGSGIKKNLVQKFFISLTVNYICLFSKKMTFMSQTHMEHIMSYSIFKKLFYKKVQIIPNFIDSNILIKKTTEIKNINSFVFVGRYTKEKGFDKVEEIARRFPNLKFFVIGDKSYNKKIKNINNLGFLSLHDILRVHRKNRALFFPTMTESFPLSILEAMSQGSVILSSRIPGIIDLIEEEKNGLLFETGDIEDMVAKINKIVRNPQLANKIGKNNLKKIQNYTSIKQLPHYGELYKEVCEHGK